MVINDRALEGLFAGIAANIETYDLAFRATHEGYPVHVVEADVLSAFPGITMDDTMRRDYAVAVSNRLPFQFTLTG